MKRIKFDNVLYLFSLLYVIIPIILFVFGWLKIYYAICIALIFLLFLIGCYKKFILNSDFIFFKKDNLVFLIVAFVLLFLWVYFSGIGGYAFQHIDFRARNPMYKDLCEVNWPIFYDLSKQSSSVRQVLGSDKVALSYYFTWWLIPASIVKLFHFKTNIANLVLYIYSSIGIFLSMFLICKYLKNCKIKYILIFIFFGGLDIIAYLIFNKELPVWYHFMEIDGAFGRWLEYHSNTNQLYTVFNQVIPTWIILGLMINLKDDKYCVAICSLIFAYSPWAMILALPIALYRIIINNIKVLLTNIYINLLVILYLFQMFLYHL